MDEKVEILLGSTKNIHSVDVDTYEKLELANKTSQIMEYDMKNALSATDLMQREMQTQFIEFMVESSTCHY
jgi:hypothetical protein